VSCVALVAFASPVVGTAMASAKTAALRAPVLTEKFTHLACNQNNTLGLEGCAEARLRAADGRVNREVHLVFTLLPTTSQKRSFVKAEDAWLASRTADCMSESAVYQGGSFTPVQYGLCEVSEDHARSTMLHSYFNVVEQGTSPKPAWP